MDFATKRGECQVVGKSGGAMSQHLAQFFLRALPPDEREGFATSWAPPPDERKGYAFPLACSKILEAPPPQGGGAADH